LGQKEFKGNFQNNIIALPGDRIEGVDVIKDEDDVGSRRYKMVFNPKHPDSERFSWSLRTATSADGIHWTAGPDGPIPSFLEFSSFYKHAGLYIVNSQIFGRREGGAVEGREAYAWISPDFDHWLSESAPSFSLTEPADISGYEGQYSQVHLGVGAASFGNVLIGLYGLWHQRGWGVGGTTGDLGLAISHDGLHFHEPVKGYIFLSHEASAVTPVPGKDYPTILTQSNGILNYGEETRIYHGRWRNANGADINDLPNFWAEVGLATLPRDRWGSFGLLPDTDPKSENPARVVAARANDNGTVWSTIIRLPATRSTDIWLNADDAHAMRLEVADENFNLLPDYSGQNSGSTQKASGLDCLVSWPKGDLTPLRGKTIRLRIRLQKQGTANPRLYVAYLRAR
jgi:hypothetical protein